MPKGERWLREAQTEGERLMGPEISGMNKALSPTRLRGSPLAEGAFCVARRFYAKQ